MSVNTRPITNITLVVGGMIVGLLLGTKIGVETVCKVFNDYDRVFITADHVPEDEYPECTKIYSDPDSDIAVYFNKAYTPTPPRVGSHVFVGEDKLKGRVTEVGDGYIICSLDDATQISAGFSGSLVTGYLNTPAGFVSSFVGGDEIRVVLF